MWSLNRLDEHLERENEILLEKISSWNITDEVIEQVRSLVKSVTFLSAENDRKELMLNSMSADYDKLSYEYANWMILPNSNFVFTVTIESFRRWNRSPLKYKFVSKRLQKMWLKNDDLTKIINKQVWMDKFVTFLSKNQVSKDTIIPSNYVIDIGWLEYNLSMSHTVEWWEKLYWVYLTPLRVFKRELIEKFQSMLAPAWLKDPETKEHLDRLKEYSRILIEELYSRWLFSHIIDEEYIEDVVLTIPLHDLWKILTEKSILLKPWRLNKTEREEMNEHAPLWWKILESELHNYEWTDLETLLRIASNIARCHHENYDGSWYPDWLIWEDIPLEARITKIVDVFDALKSKRSYKAPWPDQKVLDHITKLRWIEFDPVITDVFLDLFEQMLEIRRRITDEK